MPPTSSTEPMTSMPLSVGSFIKVGWETFKKRPWFFIFALIIFGLASAVINGIGGMLQSIVDGSATSGTGHLLAWLIQNVANVFVSIATVAFFLKAHDTPETVTYYDAWKPDFFWNFLGVYILYMLIVVAGLILFIIPGIIAALTFGFAQYLVIDKGLGPIEALKESARLTKGNRWRLLAFGGAAALIALLGFICLFVGIFVAAPVLSLANVNAYRRISAAADAHAQAPLTGGEKTLIAVGILIPVVVGIVVAVVLSTLGVARGKAVGARNEMDLKSAQMALELYRSSQGTYPASLGDISAALPGANFDPSTYNYTTDPKHMTYKLCTTNPLPQGQASCVSSEDASTTAQ